MQVPRPIEFDVGLVQSIPAVRAVLDAVCEATGMGFAVVARVTEDRWVACQVRDDIHFGIEAGDELVIETTICRDIRQSGQPVAIDEVETDKVYSQHQTPKLYGFQSYISVPLLLPDGSFFGTLCAVDTKPAHVNTPGMVGMFKLFAELIGLHLAAHDRDASLPPPSRNPVWKFIQPFLSPARAGRDAV
jgi:GAF domain-containing protein